MMFKRAAVAAAAMVAALCPTTAAQAYHDEPPCTEVPVDTVGAHAEVGDETVHVPAISNVRLCYAVAAPEGEALPASLDVLSGCGSVCFVLVVEEGNWTIASTVVQAYVTFDMDATPVYVPITYSPMSAEINNTNPVCFAVGNPIPTCPDGMVEVPVPIIL